MQRMQAWHTSYREKVSERERIYIEASYYEHTTGELEKAVQAYEMWQQDYPRDYRVLMEN